MTVFDFDKTLTNHDTLFGFYKEVAGDEMLFTFKRWCLFTVALAYKLKLISNTQLKRIGVRLFLYHKTIEKLENSARKYAQKIRLNDIYKTHFTSTPKRERIIISASLEIYLKKIFPDENVAGSTLSFRNNRVSGLECNMYGTEKVSYLKNNGINRVEKLYTDSYSDKPLMEFSNITFIVDDGKLIKPHSYS